MNKRRAKDLVVDIREYNPGLYRQMMTQGKKSMLKKLEMELDELDMQKEELKKIILERMPKTNDPMNAAGNEMMADLQAREMINEEIKQRYLM